MYVYGGIASYSDKLYNDLWVYDYRLTTWNQLQRSYVPPLPPGDTRPTDIPLAPAFKTMPDDYAPVKPAVPVVELPYNTIYDGIGFADTNANAAADFASFLQVDSTVTLPGQAWSPVNAQYPSPYNVDNAPQAAYPGAVPREVNPAVLYPQLFRKNNKPIKNLRAHFEKAYAGNVANVDNAKTFDLIEDSKSTHEWPAPPIDLWEYNLDTKLWKCVMPRAPKGRYDGNSTPANRWMHTAVNIADTMVVFGGVTAEKQIKGDLWVYNAEKNMWLETHPKPNSPRPLPRQGHCAAAVGNTMYIFGGVSYGYQPFNDLWAYNAATNEWTELSPNHPYKGIAPRWLTSCTAVEDGPGAVRFFVFGGVAKEQVPMNDLNFFDIQAGEWTKAPVTAGFAPFPRMLHNLVWMGSRLHVFGGIANNIPFDDLHYYDLNTQAWSESLPNGAFPFARGGATVAKVTPSKAAIPDRPVYSPFEMAHKPNKRWEPRYRKIWNQNNFMVLFGGVGVVQV